MNYIDRLENSEIKKYFYILCEEYPKFIDKYIETVEMQRLSKIGQFCGCDYTKLHSCKYWYSRLDHSIACALMAWHFTKDKKQTLSALFHDLGTPAFSHCIDFLLNDTVNQESSEKDVKEILSSSKTIREYLNEEEISINDVTDIQKYTIVENQKPKICIDRLEGVLHTGLVWCHFWEITDIKDIYDNITVLINEDMEKEIGFTNVEKANKFFEGAFKYSIVLQQNEDKLTMQFISDCLRSLSDRKKITLNDLYILSEDEIINIIKNDSILKERWNIFEKTEFVYRTEEEPIGKYFVSVDAKKRYVIPLVLNNQKPVRLDKVSSLCCDLLNEYLQYKDSTYAYIEF